MSPDILVKRDPDGSSKRSDRIDFTLTDPDHLTKGKRMKKRLKSELIIDKGNFKWLRLIEP